VLTLNSGSGTLTGFTLGNIKPVHIERVLTPAIDGATVGTPASFSPAAKITLGAAPQPVGPVRILGSGFSATPVQVWLDGIDVSTFGATVTPNGSQEIDVTFPAFIPHESSRAGFFCSPPLRTGCRHLRAHCLNHSNGVDFTVIEEILLDPCNVSTTSPNAPPRSGRRAIR